MINKHKRLKKIEGEEWRVIPNSDELYYASNLGRIKSYYYDKENGHIMRSTPLKQYLTTQIRFNGKRRTVLYHKVIAEAWIPRPSKEHTIVTHIDRNGRNNNISNLKWQTKDETNEINGKYFKELFSKRNHPKIVTRSKLKESDVVILKTLLEKGVTQAKIAEMFCISEMQVTRIKRGENWGQVKPLSLKRRSKK